MFFVAESLRYPGIHPPDFAVALGVDFRLRRAAHYNVPLRKESFRTLLSHTCLHPFTDCLYQWKIAWYLGRPGWYSFPKSLSVSDWCYQPFVGYLSTPGHILVDASMDKEQPVDVEDGDTRTRHSPRQDPPGEYFSRRASSPPLLVISPGETYLKSPVKFMNSWFPKTEYPAP